MANNHDAYGPEALKIREPLIRKKERLDKRKNNHGFPPGINLGSEQEALLKMRKHEAQAKRASK